MDCSNASHLALCGNPRISVGSSPFWVQWLSPPLEWWAGGVLWNTTG